MKEYLEKIRSHLRHMIDDLKKSGEWKIHLTMKPKFMLSTDSNEKRTMYSKSDSSIVMTGNDTNKIIQKLFYSLLFIHSLSIDLEISMKAGNFVFDQVPGMDSVGNKISDNKSKRQ